jgi:aminopeptidase N
MRLEPTILAVLLASVSGIANLSAAAPAPPAPTPPSLRLPEGARPTRYALDLTLSPDSENFRGGIDIDIDLSAAMPVIWLNATDLTVEEASLAMGGKTLHPQVVPGGDDFVGLAFDPPAGPGSGRLHLSYTGHASEKEWDGVFRQKEQDDWYLYTQFEPIGARKAFPCFDEPNYKVPWRITLHVGKDLKAVSNAPILGESPAADGTKEVRFAETPPLPSYLVAFGVGAFDFADGPPVGSKHRPFRVVTPKGQASAAAYAVQTVPELVSRLEKYFGIPYPYDKLDLLVIPLFGGAMENAGLVTFGRRIILARPEEERLARQREFASVAAHELAHMWFGDLVTMKWWDDIWLNESFASWMADKIVEGWKQDWDVPVDRVDERNQAIGTDRLVSARRIRQPIESRDDIQNAFDAITYEKGSAILNMLEQWIGSERFQKGVQRHLSGHAGGNADVDEFLAAVSKEAGRDVAPVFRSFVDQGGIPLVTFGLACDPGSPPSLRLAQKRYLPVGSKGSTDQRWKIPVCFRYGSGDLAARQCVLLTESQATVALDGVKKCPEWILPNDSATGYYLARSEAGAKSATGTQAGSLTRLFDDGGRRLSVPERIEVMSDLSALVSAGEIPASEVLSLVPTVVQDGNRHLLELAVGIVGGLRLNFVPSALLPNYHRFILRTFQAKARALGMTGKPGESEETQLLRPTIVSLVAVDGEDEAMQKESRELSLRWLDDHQAVPADMVDVVLGAGMRKGDQALFDRLRAAAGKTSDRNERSHLLAGLSSFQDPAIVRKRMPLLLTGEFDIREAGGLISGALEEPALRDMGYAFVKENYAALAAKIPKEFEAYLAFLPASYCDDAHRADIAAFFGERTPKAPGGPRILAQSLEQIDLCIARKKAQQASIEEFLRKQ